MTESCKIVFHRAQGGTARGFKEDYLMRLAAAGKQPGLKTCNDYGQVLETLGYGGITCFRITDQGVELPDYNLLPFHAAAAHWGNIKKLLPPEFDKRTWLETANEPDKERAEWLAEFSLHTAIMMNNEGYKYAAFGWAAGEPEVEHWRGLEMQKFLMYASANPHRCAVALHEYSYNVNNIVAGYPFLIGRYTFLNRICTSEIGISAPTILITEWGWEKGKVPAPDQAIEDIAWAQSIYGQTANVQMAALWYLGPGFDDIAKDAEKIIKPLGDWAAETDFSPGVWPVPPTVPPVIPPIEDDVLRYLWLETVQEQMDSGIRANPDAAIQRAILNEKDMSPVINEIKRQAEEREVTIGVGENLVTGERVMFLWSEAGGIERYTDPFILAGDIPYLRDE